MKPRLWLAVALLALGTACSTVPPAGSPATGAAPAAVVATNPADPWEAWNRKVFAFNDAIDDAVLKPVAQAWRDWVPQLVRTGVGNVFGNIGDVWSTANHFLQGKVGSGFEMGMRVITNTFFGIGGLLDPATEMRLPRRSEDFGQTLGVWGFGPGPYVVLPFMGPSSLRDAVGLPLDRYYSAPTWVFDVDAYLASALQLINLRADLLATTQLLNEVSLDRYSFVRDAHLSRRLNQVYDGNPPLEKFDDDAADPPPTPKKGT